MRAFGIDFQSAPRERPAPGELPRVRYKARCATCGWVSRQLPTQTAAHIAAGLHVMSGDHRARLGDAIARGQRVLPTDVLMRDWDNPAGEWAPLERAEVQR